MLKNFSLILLALVLSGNLVLKEKTRSPQVSASLPETTYPVQEVQNITPSPSNSSESANLSFSQLLLSLSPPLILLIALLFIIQQSKKSQKTSIDIINANTEAVRKNNELLQQLITTQREINQLMQK
ncbi:hypothetical protein PN462_15975 [Spirulina sp. CS-785/01]|uniref:hypothetical protein n=1 Tax=Spirulina sp. CS-785/01 TaxID=3021716 RepID=UPI00232BFED2|nr:hypothetical protein [Spirulina sp. CS-785/01]MDB9314610.1 hypothetical protein [Spirulina sp. CS-785/01]